SGFALLNGDLPKMYASNIKIFLHNQTHVDSGYVMINSEHTVIARMVPNQWQFAYNNDGSFHATGPVISRQNLSYSLVLDSNRLVTSDAGTLWKISAEM